MNNSSSNYKFLWQLYLIPYSLFSSEERNFISCWLTHLLMKKKRERLRELSNLYVETELSKKKKNVKLWFTTMCFVGFNSVPNLIVILFNFLYPVFIVGFDYKGCVIERERERESEDSSNWRLKSFRGYLATKHPAKWPMWLAHAGMRRVRTGWRQLCLTSISRVRSSRETFCFSRLSILIHTFCAYTIYTHITHKCWGMLLRENPSQIP